MSICLWLVSFNVTRKTLILTVKFKLFFVDSILMENGPQKNLFHKSIFLLQRLFESAKRLQRSDWSSVVKRPHPTETLCVQIHVILVEPPVYTFEQRLSTPLSWGSVHLWAEAVYTFEERLQSTPLSRGCLHLWAEAVDTFEQRLQSTPLSRGCLHLQAEAAVYTFEQRLSTPLRRGV